MFPGSVLTLFAAAWLESLWPIVILLAVFGLELARVVYLAPLVGITADQVTENRRMGNVFVFACLAIAGVVVWLIT